MHWFKSIGLLLLCAMLTCTACSKDKEDKAKSKSSRPVASNTVDLGEADSADADEVKSQRPARKNSRAKVVGEEDPNDDAIARKNDAAAVNNDGSAKRGKPAAELEAEEAAKNAAAPEPVAEAATEPAAEPETEAAAPEFDFAAEEKPRPPRKHAEPAPRIVQKRQGLNIENLININELREITGYAGVLEQTDLLGQNSDSHYNVIRLSTDKASELGFALQVWKLGNESAASKRFDEMFKQSFGGVKQKDIANDAFIASHHNLSELAFYDKNKRSVVLLSCSDSICKKDQLKSIATTLQRRL